MQLNKNIELNLKKLTNPQIRMRPLVVATPTGYVHSAANSIPIGSMANEKKPIPAIRNTIK